MEASDNQEEKYFQFIIIKFNGFVLTAFLQARRSGCRIDVVIFSFPLSPAPIISPETILPTQHFFGYNEPRQTTCSIVPVIMQDSWVCWEFTKKGKSPWEIRVHYVRREGRCCNFILGNARSTRWLLEGSIHIYFQNLITIMSYGHWVICSVALSGKVVSEYSLKLINYYYFFSTELYCLSWPWAHQAIFLEFGRK